jgi:hypothetical protein
VEAEGKRSREVRGRDVNFITRVFLFSLLRCMSLLPDLIKGGEIL